MKPHHPPGVEDGAHNEPPVAADFAGWDLGADVGPALAVRLHVRVGAVKVQAARHRQVLDADLEYGGVYERNPAQHDDWAADGTTQRTECAGLVNAKAAQLLDVVRLAHQAHTAPEADDVFLSRTHRTKIGPRGNALRYNSLIGSATTRYSALTPSGENARLTASPSRCGSLSTSMDS